jgi:hypothetical protein
MEIMSRTLWFVAGAASGVYSLYRVRRAAHNLTPDGIGARVAAFGVGARMFAGEVSAGMAEREAQLRTELRLTASQPPALSQDPAPAVEPEGTGDGDR